MFGIGSLLNAIHRLTDQVTRMADNFARANDSIEAALPPADRAPALPEPATETNGVAAHARKAAKGRA